MVSPGHYFAMTKDASDGLARQRILTDLEALIEIVDRRVNYFRQQGNPDAVRHLEEIRVHVLQSLAQLQPPSEQS